MIAKVYSAIPDGFNGRIVEVEGTANHGLPMFNIVGMANKTITEARERVRSAIANSGLIFPTEKITINLAPAELSKTGTHLDLPIALAILTLSGQIIPKALESRLFAGELSLDGHLKPIRGIINIVEAARSSGATEVFLPLANLPEASLVPNIQLIGVTSLLELLLHLQGVKPIAPSSTLAENPSAENVVKITSTDARPNPPASTDAHPNPFASICGQSFAKRALVIALAGHHNILLSGPPGSGKTLLAHAAASLLPPLSPDERIAATKINSLSSLPHTVQTSRPFREPHHTASPAAIIGGGPNLSPGEISLAHSGILFLDEFPEFPRSVLEALRQPLENHNITISRATGHTTYPADFTLIATMNPCPCGHFGDPDHPCSCTPIQIKNYHDRISGPILDRIDLRIEVEPVKNHDLARYLSPSTPAHNTTKPSQEQDTDLLAQISHCYEVQHARYSRPDAYNGSLSSQDISKYLHLAPGAQSLLEKASKAFRLSARSYFKVIKVAQTIADLAGSSDILQEHISEALAYRQKPEHANPIF